MNHIEEFLQSYIDNAPDPEQARQEIRDAVATVVGDDDDAKAQRTYGDLYS